MIALLLQTGEFVRRVVTESGQTLVLLFRAVRFIGSVPRQLRTIVWLMYQYGVRSLPVTSVVALFTGMIFALQTGIELARLGQQESVGTLVAVVMCREMGPFITGLILAACVGSAIAAELATMKVSEEVDALEVMSIPPERFLVLPRLLAVAIITPLITVLTSLIGVMGGALVASLQLHVSYTRYFRSALDALRYLDDVFNLPKDIYTGLFKSFVFGIIIAAIGCGQGLRARGGALGVGRATRLAVVNAFLLIIVSSYVLTALFYRSQ
jgi:phospholipid/cholesterol/gamma-HCH transport system permease protein